jgi:hypothetical protein
MKTKLLGVVAVFVLLGAAPVTATTYNYVSDLYTNVGINPSIQNPAIYGTYMTGTATFTGDTSHFTGTIWLSSGQVADMALTSGTITATYFDIFPLQDYFRFEDGAIKEWLLHAGTNPFSEPTPGYQLYSQGMLINEGTSFASTTGFDNVQSWFPSGTTYASRNQSVTSAWTMETVETPLPATLPLFATGLGALGLLGWRRKRKG